MTGRGRPWRRSIKTQDSRAAYKVVLLGIEHPFGHTSCGIYCCHLGERGAGVERGADHQRRGFVGTGGTEPWIAVLDGVVWGLPASNNAQILGDGAIDLIKWRIAGCCIGARVRRPFAATWQQRNRAVRQV
jgi:hypothetical protein